MHDSLQESGATGTASRPGCLLMLPHMNPAQAPWGSDHPGVSVPFPHSLSHCRCRGPWHEKPFLQIYMCSNLSINNWSCGYPFSWLEVSGLPCLVSLIWAMWTLGPCNLTISESEWMCYSLYRVYCACALQTQMCGIWTFNMMLWEFLWLSQTPDVMQHNDKSFSIKLSCWVWVKLSFPLQWLFTHDKV